MQAHSAHVWGGWDGKTPTAGRGQQGLWHLRPHVSPQHGSLGLLTWKLRALRVEGRGEGG
jgi:hypothetical protein